MTQQRNEIVPFMEKTTAFGNGSFSKGDPGGGFPITLTSCTSPGWITGDLLSSQVVADRVREESIPRNYHVALEVLQFLRLLINDTGKNFVRLKPSMNVSNAD